MISGTANNDTLSTGSSGLDLVISGGPGNDVLTGLNRASMAYFSGKYSEYTISTSAGVITVTDKFPATTTRTVSDGTDTLYGMNLLRFSDRDYFVTAAANKITLPGITQTYQVSNSEWVLGSSAVETFVIKPQTSSLIAIGAGDILDISGNISSYSFANNLSQLRISDGTYTTFINIGGQFTLRSASGSTPVAYTGGKIVLGADATTGAVGGVGFNPSATITNPSNTAKVGGDILVSTANPTITSLNTVDTTPTLAGTVIVGDAQVFTVTVNGTQYTKDSGLVINANTWNLTIPDNKSLAFGSYDVIAELKAAPIPALNSVTGSANNDTLSAPPVSPNKIEGGAGNDTLTGGSRADIAVFSGKYADYTITTSAGVVTVTDKFPATTTRTVSDGIDTLYGLNLLRFADRDYFVTAAANKVTLPGMAQTYQVSNSEWVLGSSAVETFVIKPQTSSLIAIGIGDILDLSGLIGSYAFASNLSQLRISDGTYTTFINIGGQFTLRTASGSTPVAYTGGKIVLGLDATVGSVGVSGFNASATITSPQNVSSNANKTLTDLTLSELTIGPVNVTTGEYFAKSGQNDYFLVNADNLTAASIVGFERGDQIKIINWSAVNVDPLPTEDIPPHLDLLIGQDAKILSLSNLVGGYNLPDGSVISSVAGFNAVFGPNAIVIGDAGLDQVAPSIAVSIDKAVLASNEYAILTFILSEPSEFFAADDLQVSGGTISNFTGSGVAYSAKFTPAIGSTSGAVTVASGKFTDQAGNLNVDGADSNNTVQFTIVAADTTGPTFQSPTSYTAIENQNLLYTAVATDASAPVTYALSGADMALLAIGTDGKVTLQTGVLDFDAANAKKVYNFNVIASDAKSNSTTQAITVQVSNSTTDDAIATPLDSQSFVGTQDNYATLNAQSTSVAVSDDITKSDYVKITGFGADDTIAFSGSIDANLKGYVTKAEDVVSFNVNGHDIELSINNNGVVSNIILADVITNPDTTFVYDLASFNALPIGDLTLVGIQLPV